MESNYVWLAAVLVGGVLGLVFLFRVRPMRPKKVSAGFNVGKFISANFNWQEQDGDKPNET